MNSNEPKFKPISNSEIYRKRIKRMVESTKILRGIPWGRKISRGINKVKHNASGPAKMAQDHAEQFTLTMSTLHFFAAPYARSAGPVESVSNVVS